VTGTVEHCELLICSHLQPRGGYQNNSTNIGTIICHFFYPWIGMKWYGAELAVMSVKCQCVAGQAAFK
jgi:hypothetical protein